VSGRGRVPSRGTGRTSRPPTLTQRRSKGQEPFPAPAAPSVSREHGFTLLEVLVAFAILSIAVVTTIQGFAGGLRLLRLAGEHQQAILLADQKLREVVRPAEERTEDAEGAYRWERTITIVPTPDLARTPATEMWHVYRIAVKVSWGDTRSVTVATLRTSAEPRQTPGARP